MKLFIVSLGMFGSCIASICIHYLFNTTIHANSYLLRWILISGDKVKYVALTIKCDRLIMFYCEKLV